MNRSADWLDQARADLDLAAVREAAGHHEWACVACTLPVRLTTQSLREMARS